LPEGETKIALAAVPSMPSQFESTNARSGWSGAPGLIAGSFGAQSRESGTPSPSRSAGGGGVVVVVVVGGVVVVAGGVVEVGGVVVVGGGGGGGGGVPTAPKARVPEKSWRSA
jgi:hypothetical protein